MAWVPNLELNKKNYNIFFYFNTENRPSTDRFFRYLWSVTEKPKIGIFAITASFWSTFLKGFKEHKNEVVRYNNFWGFLVRSLIEFEQSFCKLSNWNSQEGVIETRICIRNITSKSTSEPTESISSEAPPSAPLSESSPPQAEQPAPIQNGYEIFIVNTSYVTAPDSPADPQYNCPIFGDTVECVKGQTKVTF